MQWQQLKVNSSVNKSYSIHIHKLFLPLLFHVWDMLPQIACEDLSLCLPIRKVACAGCLCPQPGLCWDRPRLAERGQQWLDSAVVSWPVRSVPLCLGQTQHSAWNGMEIRASVSSEQFRPHNHRWSVQNKSTMKKSTWSPNEYCWQTVPMLVALKYPLGTSAKKCPDFSLYCECIHQQHTKQAFFKYNHWTRIHKYTVSWIDHQIILGNRHCETLL